MPELRREVRFDAGTAAAMSDILTVVLPLWRRVRGRRHVVGSTRVSSMDAPRFSSERWFLNSNGYVSRPAPRGKHHIYLHREVMNLSRGNALQVDHFNRDRLDNRRHNLRTVTRAQNLQNTSSSRRGSSRFRGVHWDRRAARWRAEVKVDGRAYRIGSFTSERAAADAARAFRRQHLPYSMEEARNGA